MDIFLSGNGFCYVVLLVLVVVFGSVPVLFLFPCWHFTGPRHLCRTNDGIRADVVLLISIVISTPHLILSLPSPPQTASRTNCRIHFTQISTNRSTWSRRWLTCCYRPSCTAARAVWSSKAMLPNHCWATMLLSSPWLKKACMWPSMRDWWRRETCPWDQFRWWEMFSLSQCAICGGVLSEHGAAQKCLYKNPALYVSRFSAKITL